MHLNYRQHLCSSHFPYTAEDIVSSLKTCDFIALEREHLQVHLPLTTIPILGTALARHNHKTVIWVVVRQDVLHNTDMHTGFLAHSAGIQHSHSYYLLGTLYNFPFSTTSMFGMKSNLLRPLSFSTAGGVCILLPSHMDLRNPAFCHQLLCAGHYPGTGSNT